MKQIWVFGNADLEQDSLPINIIPELQKRFLKVEFAIKNPNDEWDNIPDPFIIIDTVQGIKEVTEFTDLKQFASPPRTTVHDFDLGMKLRWLAKLGKLPPFVIIGVPPELSEAVAVEQVTALFHQRGF